uniref:ER membrane protein complex subunit 2 n=1 Tax=Eucampia antarctica TaxID=49252 RepID=A0A7S2WFV2_9STRA|mmetsp:Transcript_29380/g.28253  ORF Transcript_29380/g.28253 Transcript_29380/m.28253 type:complete len:312 (+) Transcript_29380:72-1007(+)|eukprot:CAMPEP_0197834366 /NCGR_PEP_ID=MMETSP1437-20131217/22092_1 /TAXON_ID=49252 ORGANISM="Eucampia antarctica, Strain CCMP1452" /NCGR_SAMPLE_ID=MMETSP1437 /ASSEMBLY_ACC=CAM_ASM_001096 /LENGTH=311 /DNA_ID=CAMNT_0043438971 /DNA_START=72 /DNA_END=1007 /DNA_ORIENTATION=-
MMMGPEEDLPTLLKRSDHLGVLRYVRAHKIRDPELVVEHGTLLLGTDLSKCKGSFLYSKLEENERLGALEQICIAALDIHESELAAKALDEIMACVGNGSRRFRRLLGLCLESSNDLSGAAEIYNDLLRENPSNMFCLKRKYCILRTLHKDEEAREALNDYLEKNGSDVGAWAEMAKFCAEVGDCTGAAFCYEEIVLACPLDSDVHCTLAEWYVTIGGKENLKLARKHMAQSLELNPNNLRAMYGLLNAANAYIQEVETKKSKKDDSNDVDVAKELIKYASEKLSKVYKGTGKTSVTVQNVLKQMTLQTEA